MFATLLGPLPRPPLPPDLSPTVVLEAVVRAQEAAGLEPLIDGGFGVGATPVERWRATAALTDRPVKAVLIGPYSTAAHPDEVPAKAEAGNADLRALAAAGCPYLEIHEPGATDIGADATRRTRFRDAHRRLLDGVDGPHLSLVITGGSADAAGLDTLLAAPYASLAVDLIEGPDNWRLVAAAHGDLGIVCGALSTARHADDRVEILLWAADYAASTAGRGRLRVGLGSASSLAHLPWDVAVRKLKVLGEAARLADLPADERRLRLDPRAVDIRSAALGQVQAKRRPRPAGPRHG
jgi:methionine synthase II (cobalamin-independent)